MAKKSIPVGVILYEGPSLIDGKPIVVIANSFKSNNNRKIGNMVQTWIIRADIHPHDVLKANEEKSICGDCIHTGEYDPKTGKVLNRTCYVNLMKQGVFSVYNTYKRGSYTPFKLEHASLFQGRHVRIGSYGDPSAVPLAIWSSITKFCKDYTGYTHAWKNCDQELSRYCMASCNTLDDYRKADIMGWRTFRVLLKDEDHTCVNEMKCPAQTHGAHCDTCVFCNGSLSNRKNITVDFHGATGRYEQYKRKIEKLNSLQD